MEQLWKARIILNLYEGIYLKAKYPQKSKKILQFGYLTLHGAAESENKAT